MTIKVLTALLMLVATSLAANAQSAEFEKFSISIGVFLTDRDTDTRLDGDVLGTGTPVNLEDEFGLDKSDSVFRLDGYYRFNERHRIDFSVFDLSRSASTQIDRDIDWNDTLYPINAAVDSQFDLDIYKVAYTWSFLHREKGYIGATLGLYVADIGTSVSAEMIGASSVGGVTAPLPVLGLRAQYEFNEKWSARGSAEFFALEYGDFTGSLNDLYVGIDYRLFERVAVGVGWNSVEIDVGVKKANFAGDLDWSYNGGLIFLKFNF